MTRLRVAGRILREIGKLSGLALWRGFLGFYNSDNLTYAASIAYYALLSLFPFSMLALAILGSATADEQTRNAVLGFVLHVFSDAVRLHHDAARLVPRALRHLRRRWHAGARSGAPSACSAP